MHLRQFPRTPAILRLWAGNWYSRLRLYLVPVAGKSLEHFRQTSLTERSTLYSGFGVKFSEILKYLFIDCHPHPVAPLVSH
jgi:hypothetical protein